MAKFLDRVKTAVGLQEENQQPTGFWESLDESTTLSRTQRLWGFGTTAGFGMLFMVLAMALAWIPPYTKFAVLYTLGSVCFFGSTFFLMGPLKQEELFKVVPRYLKLYYTLFAWGGTLSKLKSLTKKYRLAASIVYIVSLALTLWAAFGPGKVILVLLFFVIQFIALGWYILTYIPYGQQAAGSFFSSMFS